MTHLPPRTRRRAVSPLPPLIMALEPRVMFDGAAVADAADAAADAAAKALIPAVAAPNVVREADPSKDNGKKEVAFVDTSVKDYQTLEAGIRDGVEILEIHGGQSGLAQMAKWAETHSGYDSISVLSHGSEGHLLIGTDTVTDAALATPAVQAELAEIGHALKVGGDLLLYGCDIAKGADGQQFITDLAAATGADVAASTDATGAADKGGDWVLESSTGTIEASSFAAPDFAGILVNTAPTDVNFTAPTTGHSLTVNSGGSNTIVGTLTATDANVGDTFTYSFGGGTDDASFTLTGSTLKFAANNTGGTYNIRITATDQGGLSVTQDLTVLVNPQCPTVTGTISADTGTSSTDKITSDTTLAVDISNTINGATVSLINDANNNFIYDAGDTVLATGTGTGGTITLTTSALSDGTYYFNAVQTIDGVMGGTGSVLNDTLNDSTTIVIDTAGPTASVTTIALQAGTNVTSARTTEAGRVYLVRSDATVTDMASLEALVSGGTAKKTVQNTANTNTTIATTGLADGTYKVYSVDKAGNVSAASTNSVIIDSTGPTATINSHPDATTNGGTSYTFTVDYSDSGTGLDTTTLDGNDITVTGPNAFSGSATYVSRSGNTVTYSITPPGGSWDATDIGTYTITLNASQVTDGLGNSAASGSLGTFNVAAGPSVTSATYDASTGTLVVTGDTIDANGSGQDIDVSKLTLTGEGGATYTLTTANVERDSATQFTVVLNATDKAALNQIMNKAGTGSTGSTTFNIAAADDWCTNVTTGDTSDATNPVTVSNPDTPTITSTTYDAGTGVLTLTGSGFLKLSGAANDIVANKFTFTGQGNTPYTLTDTANVEITNGTTAVITLSATDKAAVNALLNNVGTTSGDGTTYNLAAAEDWAAGADAAVTVADATTGITVSATPSLTSATYDASTGTLVVTGAAIQANGSGQDINVSTLTLTGEGGATYTLTTANVERDSATQFTVTLNAADKAALNQIMNKTGTSSTGSTTFNLAAADDWCTNVTTGDTSDATNPVTVSNPDTPTITSTTYDAGTGVLTLTGTGFLKLSGAANDIVANKFTFTGQGNTPYTLTDTANVEITDGTTAVITLSATDKAAVNLLLNNVGTSSSDNTTYNLAAAEDWAAGAAAAVNVADATTLITVSASPAITSATYDASTGTLVVTGSYIDANGSGQDIDVSKLTLTGEGGATYTLTTASVERTNATQFTVTLNATDKAALNQIMNKAGTSSTGSTTFNIAAADDWCTSVTAGDTSDATNPVTVSNPHTPTITSTDYNYATGVLTLTGTGFLKLNGAANDILANKFTFTGQGAGTYTLTDTANVEITNGTTAVLTLSATDKAAVNLLLNNAGTTSTGGTTYNVAAAEDWAAGADAAVNLADPTTGVTVSMNPAITSATYDASTGTLVVTGAAIQANGAGQDIDVSKLTLTGEGGATYTLTTANVERDSATQFTVTLNAADKVALNQIMNKAGTSSTGSTTFNIAAADDWCTSVTAGDTSDATNPVTVNNPDTPTITSSTYDATSGVLTLTGTGFLKLNGAANDIVANKFTFRGEGNATYTLTDTANVEITNGTTAVLTLSATDKAAVNLLLNNVGTASSGGTAYNLAAAEDWAAGAAAAVNLADPTTGVTVSAPPTITSATYDASTGTLVVTGTYIQANGAGQDIDVSKLTLTGEGGATYTLTAANVERDSTTQFTVTLNAADKAALNQIMNKAGTSSTGSTTFNIAADDDWCTSVTAGDTSDATNPVTVSNPHTPTITSTDYNYATGVLTLTGTGFLKLNGAANDIVANKFTFRGEGNATYTLTDTANVEITNDTTAVLTLSATDKAAVNRLMNKVGTASTGGTTYNVAAAEDWAAGAAAAVNVADATSAITVSGVPAPGGADADNNSNSNAANNADDSTVDDRKPGSLGDSTDKGTAGLSTVIRDGADTGSKTGGDSLQTVVRGTTGGFGLGSDLGRGWASGFGASVGGDTGRTMAQATIGLEAMTVPARDAFQVVVVARGAGGADALVMNRPMTDTVIDSGMRLALQIPPDAFAHTRADATVTLFATRSNGAALPGWMNFNPRTGTFEGTPPPGFKGEVVVKVTARDNEGREAVQTFKIVVGEAGQGQGQGQPRPQGQRQGMEQPVGRLSLSEQLRSMGKQGQLAKQAAFVNALTNGTKGKVG